MRRDLIRRPGGGRAGSVMEATKAGFLECQAPLKGAFDATRMSAGQSGLAAAAALGLVCSEWASPAFCPLPEGAPARASISEIQGPCCPSHLPPPPPTLTPMPGEGACPHSLFCTSTSPGPPIPSLKRAKSWIYHSHQPWKGRGGGGSMSTWVRTERPTSREGGELCGFF